MTVEKCGSVPLIRTERLILRRLRVEDAEGYYNYHTDESVLEFYDWKPADMSDAAADIKSIQSECDNMSRIHWAVSLKENDSIIGDLGVLIDAFRLKGEVNYMLSKEFWGRGYMTEALGAVIFYCFSELDLLRIQALSDPGNHMSNSLLKRLSFRQEGLLRKYGYNAISSQPVDLIMWSLLKGEYEKKL